MLWKWAERSTDSTAAVEEEEREGELLFKDEGAKFD